VNQQIPNIETGIAEIDAFVRTSYKISVLDAWDRLLAERQELQGHIKRLEDHAKGVSLGLIVDKRKRLRR